MTDFPQHHVFFVDDEPEVRSVVQKTLERQGIMVTCFASASSCLKHLLTERCDLLITDVKMPGMDGMELLSEARRTMPWLPVLVVTGYGDVPLAVKALKIGAVNFIEKPLERDSFLLIVESILNRTVAPVSISGGPLTHAEAKVLRLLLEGKNNKEIATALHRSRRTIETHRSHIMCKFGVNNLVDLVRRAALMGLIEIEPPRQ